MASSEEKLNKIFALFDDDKQASKEDVAKVFKAVVDYIGKLSVGFSDRFTAHKQDTQKSVDKATSRVDAFEKIVNKAATKDDVKKAREHAEAMVSGLSMRIETLNIPEEADFSSIEERLGTLEQEPDVDEDCDPIEVRDALETLKDDERLDWTAIRGMHEFMQEMRKEIQGARGMIVAQQRGQVRVYDLSDQLNGVLKTFQLPAFGRILSVQSTSTPNVYRPTTDYTSDGKLMKITFTSQVDASTTLSAGQSLIVLYAEN